MSDNLEQYDTLCAIQGKTLAQAESLLEGHNWRITRKDRTNYICIMNLDTSRFNLEVDAGVVTKVSMG